MPEQAPHTLDIKESAGLPRVWREFVLVCMGVVGGAAVASILNVAQASWLQSSFSPILTVGIQVAALVAGALLFLVWDRTTQRARQRDRLLMDFKELWRESENIENRVQRSRRGRAGS